MLRKGVAALVILGVASMVSSASAQSQTYRPKVGAPHPGFVLPAIDDGRAVALSQFRGKKILLIHFASW